MKKILTAPNYDKWFNKLRDINAKARINARIYRMSLGLYGDAKSVGDGVSELRIDYGPGYRVYFTERGSEIIILLVGGDKSTQAKDIKAAKKLAAEY